MDSIKHVDAGKLLLVAKDVVGDRMKRLLGHGGTKKVLFKPKHPAKRRAKAKAPRPLKRVVRVVRYSKLLKHMRKVIMLSTPGRVNERASMADFVMGLNVEHIAAKRELTLKHLKTREDLPELSELKFETHPFGNSWSVVN